MGETSRQVEYRFGRFSLVPAERELRVGNEAIPLGPRAFDVLVVLVSAGGHVVAKDEILRRVWHGLVVEENNLQVQISSLRKILGYDAIVTNPGIGYRFALTVETAATEPVLPELPSGRLAEPSRSEGESAEGGSMPACDQDVLHGRRRRSFPRLAAMIGGALIVVCAALVTWLALRSAGVPRKGPQQSVSVLGFKAEGEAPGAQEMATGLATDIVYELARNADLRVVSEHSSFTIGAMGLGPSEMAQRLGSRYLVDGVARRSGDVLLLRVQLVDAQDGRIVWSERYETGADGLAEMRDKLTQKVAGTVHGLLRQNEASEALTRPPVTLDTYSRVWRAVALKHQYRPDATREAQRLLTQAIAQDPSYAPAWAYLGMVNALDTFFGLSGEWTAVRAEEIVGQAQRAIDLDPRLPAAYLALADGHWLAGRYRDALLAAHRCAELGPSDTYCLQALAWMQLGSGDAQGALRTIEQALDLSPVVPPWLTATYAEILWALRRHDDALQQALSCRRALPGYMACGRVIITALVESGRVSEARERIAQFIAKFPNHSTRDWAAYPSPGAADLQARVLAAARAAGVPELATSSPRARNP